MIERVFTFGSHNGLVGVLTEPDASQLQPDAPAVIFANVGLNHRVGPNRIYVELARRLAASGLRSLRFDLSGFGDSEPRRTPASDLERSMLDTREAMDFLERKSLKRFVLVGFCSGVDSSHRVAVKDDRVVGAVYIDGYGYRNIGFWLRHYTIRNLQPARWKRYFRMRRIYRTAPPAQYERRDAPTPEIFDLEYPTQEQFALDVAGLVRRDVKMLFIYTVVADDHYNYRGQFHDTFGYRDEIEVEYYKRADHVFSTEEHRERLLSRLVRWMDANFPARATLPHASSVVQSASARESSRHRQIGVRSHGNLIA